MFIYSLPDYAEYMSPVLFMAVAREPGSIWYTVGTQ